MDEKDDNELLLYEPHSPDSGRTTLQFSIHPVGSYCNLQCDYCFWKGHKKSFMSTERLEMILRKIADFVSSSPKSFSKISFNWNGGEPMLAGKSFYLHIVNLQRRVFPSSIEVQNEIQTNGSLIDNWYAEFFAEHKFGVGVSFDGIPEIHDKHRKDPKGNPTSEIVERGIRLLRENEVYFSVWSTITDDMLGREDEIYQYLKSLGPKEVCLKPALDLDRPKSHFTLNPDAYAQFMIRMFEIWTGKEGPNPFVRFLKSCVSKMVGLPPRGVLDFKIHCGGIPALYPNGKIYYCYAYEARPDYFLGDICMDDLSIIISHACSDKRLTF